MTQQMTQRIRRQQRHHRYGEPGRMAARSALRRAARFVKVLAPDLLAFADYSGNRQYISVGNLAENDRMFMLVLDYAQGTRLVWRGDTIDDDPRLLESVRDPDYRARVERAIRMRIEAWDTNCNSHIPKAGTVG
jgi:predicted pyridoxine 5'-phosphate oxidase superfamily flavin-nucleotide-binding protein